MSSATDGAAAKAETTDESKHAFGGAGALVANGEGEGDVKVAVETTTNSTTTATTTALDDSESDAPTPAASPMPTQTPLPGRPNERVYTAVYSGIPVYEMMYKGIQIMRRIDDSRLNATQILKAAGFSKPKRTKILELEVLQLVHEKIQGGYGKYQGTWISKENGIILARRHRVEHILKPLIDFEESNGDVALTKLNFNATHTPVASSSSSARVPTGERAASLRADAASQRASSDRSDTSQPGSPLSSPMLPRPQRFGSSSSTTNNSTTHSSTLATSNSDGNANLTATSTIEANTILNSPNPFSQSYSNASPYSAPIEYTPPPVPVKRPVGRPPRIPRPVLATAPPTPIQTKLAPPKPAPKKRRLSETEIEFPTSPPGVRMRMNMELGNAVFLTNHLDTDEWASSKPAKLVYDPSYDARTPAHRPVLNLEATPPPSEYIPSTFTRDQLQREVILAIHANKPTSEILHLLRDASIPLPEDTDPSTLPYPNPNMILDARQHTALHWAATFARTQLVETLLSYNANPCAMNLNLETPLMRASCSRSAYDAQNYDTLLTLLAPISARQKDQAGQTVLHKIAVSASNNAGDQIAQTYYMKCIVEWIDDGGFLSWLNPKDTVSSLGADVYKSKVKSVVAGFVNARDERGDTALHVAVRGRCVGIVRLLVKLGASTELWNEEGEKPGDLCDEDDSVMIEALRFWSLAGGRRNRGRYQPEEEYPLDQFEQQIEACQSEITNLHRSQTRLERLHQRSLDLAKKFKQTAFRPIIKPTISLERFSTSPATSVTLSVYESNSATSSPKKLPAIQLPSAALAAANGGSSAPNSDNESSPPLKQASLVPQQTTSPTPQILLSPVPAPGSILSQDPPAPDSCFTTPQRLTQPLLPTPPSTTKAPLQTNSPRPNASALHKLQRSIFANERIQKRLFEEIEQVWMSRVDKTKRFKNMLAETCEVSVERIEDELLVAEDGTKI